MMRIRKKLLFNILSVVAVILAVFAAKTYPTENKLIAVGDENFGLTFVDVGQGDATFIKAPCGTTVLIDGGEFDEYSSRLEPFLNSLGVERVDIAIASHYHSDHLGGIYELVRDSRVGTLILPDYPDTDDTKASIEKLAQKGLK